MKRSKSIRLGFAGGVALVLLTVSGFLLASQAATIGTLSIGSATIAPGATGQVDLSANVSSPGLGAWTVDIYYDPTLVSVPTAGCAPQQGGVCNPAYSANRIRIAGANANGLIGAKVLGTITFICSSTGTSSLQLITSVFADATVGAPAPITPDITNGSITCAQQPTSTVQPPSPTPTAVPQPTGPVRANGKIAFVSDRDGNKEIYVMNPDGSGQTNLTHNAAADYDPAWSPDGSQLAFVSERDGDPDVYVMDADGRNVRRLTANPGKDIQPTWSPDGTRIAFMSSRSERVARMDYSLFVMASRDGSGVTELTADIHEGVCICEPAWSPDGARIAFIGPLFPFLSTMSTAGDHYQGVIGNNNSFYSESSPNWSPDGGRILFVGNYPKGYGSNLYSINPDGSGQSEITHDSARYGVSVYSPDGASIAFCRASASSMPSDIYVMRSDGTGEVRLTTSSGSNCDPDWQPTQTTPVASPLAVPNAGSGPDASPTPGLLTWIAAGVAGAGLAWLAAGLVGTCLSGVMTGSGADAGPSFRVYRPRMKPIGQSPPEHKHQE